MIPITPEKETLKALKKSLEATIKGHQADLNVLQRELGLLQDECGRLEKQCESHQRLHDGCKVALNELENLLEQPRKTDSAYRKGREVLKKKQTATA